MQKLLFFLLYADETDSLCENADLYGFQPHFARSLLVRASCSYTQTIANIQSKSPLETRQRLTILYGATCEDFSFIETTRLR
ncbi:hypothetical protein [Flavobacterium hercynium]|uniref:hypothetical protein n=1 Tax=Flavobacterium hercynium TaxID=387094 RepID=UPI000F4F0ED4|nr:hypothetical protein [Flavobacterium hercynium]